MKLSSKTWIVVGVAFFVFGALWVSQILYFDAFTKKLSVQGIGPVFSGHLSENLESAVKRPLTLQAEEKNIVLEPEQLQTWIESYHRVFTGRTELRLNQQTIRDELDDFVAGLTTKPVNARFGFADGQIVETVPSKPGQKLDLEASQYNIVQALIHDQSTAQLAFMDIEPDLNLQKLQDLGINTLLGQGTSQYAGSSASRVHNIKIGAEHMDNVLIPAGTTFSFVDQLCDVDAAAGYLPGLVIKNNQLIPEYGGGICQVATTMFRAAIYAGLRIDERRPHSIPVGYYNPQGFDATVYPGVVDLKFTNDTPGMILIQSLVEKNKLTFLMFGTSDGRSVKLDGPYQYDYQPDGALKAVFTRIITLADGTQQKDTFRSSYKSPHLEIIKNPLE